MHKYVIKCSIRDLHVFNKMFFLAMFQVSWMRRDGENIKLLTWGLHTYSNDARYGFMSADLF